MRAHYHPRPSAVLLSYMQPFPKTKQKTVLLKGPRMVKILADSKCNFYLWFSKGNYSIWQYGCYSMFATKAIGIFRGLLYVFAFGWSQSHLKDFCWSFCKTVGGLLLFYSEKNIYILYMGGIEFFVSLPCISAGSQSSGWQRPACGCSHPSACCSPCGGAVLAPAGWYSAASVSSH